MLELLALLLVIGTAGGIAVVAAGLIIGIVVAVLVGILMMVLGLLGLIGKVLFLPLAVMFWIAVHPLLALLIIGCVALIVRDRRRAAI